LAAKLFTSDLKDVRAEYAGIRIGQTEREQGLSARTKAVEEWAKQGVVLWWTANPPDGLEVGTRAKVAAAGKDSIMVSPQSGGDVVIPMTGFEFGDPGFERTS
jgi:hypothetical protein